MNRKHLALIAGVLLASACADGGSPPTAPIEASFGQAQVNVASTPAFSFLSPLGDASPPAGVFDALAAPVVQLCPYAGPAWSEADCATPLEQWTADAKGPRKLAIASWPSCLRGARHLIVQLREPCPDRPH